MLKVSKQSMMVSYVTYVPEYATHMCVKSGQINIMEFYTSNLSTVLHISKYLCLIENSVRNVQLSPQSNTNCYFNIIKILQILNFHYKTNTKNSLWSSITTTPAFISYEIQTYISYWYASDFHQKMNLIPFHAVPAGLTIP